MNKIYDLLVSLTRPYNISVGVGKAQEHRVKEIVEISFRSAFVVNDLHGLEKNQFQRGLRTWLAEGMPSNGVPELDIPVATFVYQPLGTQGFPDFLVRDELCRYWTIEAKYSKSNMDCIVWNEGHPRHHDNALYVVSAPGSTVVVCGSSMINPETVEHIRKAKKGCDEKCREQVTHIQKVDEYGMNFRCDNRIQVFSKSPLYHPDRKAWVSRALDLAMKT